MYAALLALAIEEMAHEQSITAETPGVGDGRRIPRSNDQPYMGWIIDDFPGTVEQVRYSRTINIEKLDAQGKRSKVQVAEDRSKCHWSEEQW